MGWWTADIRRKRTVGGLGEAESGYFEAPKIRCRCLNQGMFDPVDSPFFSPPRGDEAWRPLRRSMRSATSLNVGSSRLIQR